MTPTGRVVSAALVVAASLAFTPAAAVAGPGLYITLYNHLDPFGGNVRVALHNNGGSDCWDDRDLAADMNSKSAGPGQSVTYYTEKVIGVFSCNTGGGTRGIALYVDEGNGFQKYGPGNAPDPDYRIHFDLAPPSPEAYGFNFLNSLRTWLPRVEGRGLLCWQTHNRFNPNEGGVGTGHVDIHVFGDASCNAARSATIAPGTSATVAPGTVTRASAPAGAAAGDAAPVVTTLGQLARQACSYGPAVADRSGCASAVSGSWVLDYLTTDVTNFQHQDSATADPKSPVAHNQLSIPPDGRPGRVAVENSVKFSFENSTKTTFGWGLTEKLGFEKKWNLPLIGKTDISFEIESDQEWSKEQENTQSQDKETQLSIEAEAEPGYTTRLDVYTPKRDATYTYTADLGFGKSGGVEPVVTPAPSALDMSPAVRIPCLAVAVGDKTVRNSVMNINQELINAGVSPTEPTLPADERGFLQSAPRLSVGSAGCPGFPPGFASTASFHGEGFGQFSAFGYQPDGTPVDELVGCVSTSRYAGSGASLRAAGADDPCQNVPPNGGTVDATPANLIDARRGAGASRRLLGTDISDTVLGGARGERIDPRAGTLDRVEARGGPDRVRGGPGQDWIDGGSGNDVLSGGSRHDYLTGGAGRDRLRDRGAGDLLGETGNDRLSAAGLAGALDGGAGADVLIARGRLRRTGLAGGLGDDRYVLRGRGVPEIVELPRGGYDTIATSRKLTVPTGVERAVASGRRPVALRAAFGTQRLVGNRARNVLRGGPGADRLSGQGGNDTLILGDDAFDTGRGGRGADRFVATGSPQRFPRHLAVPRRRTAHRLSDFNARAGDRLILRRSVFGPELEQLRRSFVVERGRKPRPKRRRATLLFDTRRHLLSFDRDGTGPIADKVIAVLPAAQTVSRSHVILSRR